MDEGDLAVKSPNSLLFFNCVKQDYEYRCLKRIDRRMK